MLRKQILSTWNDEKSRDAGAFRPKRFQRDDEY